MNYYMSIGIQIKKPPHLRGRPNQNGRPETELQPPESFLEYDVKFHAVIDCIERQLGFRQFLRHNIKVYLDLLYIIVHITIVDDV